MKKVKVQDFDRGYEYAQAMKALKKITKESRGQKKNKHNILWEMN